jgi:hypothetical protein
MNWLHYLLEANLYLCVFYAGYCLFLNKETHYTLNRVYLLLSCVVSFILPVVQIGWLKPIDSATTVVIIAHAGQHTVINETVTKPALTPQDFLIYCYIFGTIVLALVLFIRLYQLSKLTKASKTLVNNKYKLVNIEGSNTAFSFFNYLFIGTKTPASNIIIRHELVHIRQKHSADIVFLELIKIINWFNPLIYLLQMSLKTIHEYIADEQTAAQESDAISYSSFLVSNAYGLNGSPLAHSFFNYNLLKKRIIMLNQKRSGKLARLKYLVAVPICAGLLCASTLVFSKSYGFIDLMPKQQIDNPMLANAHTIPTDTVVVDPIRIKKADVTAKGYKYEEIGYLVNKKTDFRVIITEKNGEQKEYYKSKSTPEELAALKTKYGYTFPKMLIYPNLPPPPPAPPAPGKSVKVVKVKFPPPAPPAPGKNVKVVDIKFAPPAPPAPPKKNKKTKVVDVVLVPPAPPANVQQPVPPPPPPRTPFEDLYSFIAKHVRYPTKARDNNIWGREIVSITIADGKIQNSKIIKSLDPEIDAEVLRALNNYNGQIKIKSGTYNVDIAMMIASADGEKTAFELSNNIKDPKAPGYEGTALSQVVIMTYPEKK